MPRVPVYNTAGEAVGEVELRDDVFGVEVNEPLMHSAVVMYLANQRVGTAFTRTRAEVRGGGRKPWRQKGTGLARHGSIRSPLWRKGGVAFGPRPRDHRIRMPRKARRNALKSALSAKVRANQLYVLDRLELEAPRTREVARILRNLRLTGRTLLVTAGVDPRVYKSSRNIQGVSTTPAPDLNAYQVLSHDRLVMTRDAVARVEEVLGR